MSKLVEHLNGLKKVELSGLVELGLAQDLIKFADTAINMKMKAFDDIAKASASALATRRAYGNVINIVIELDKKFKELGVPIPNDMKITGDTAKKDFAQWDTIAKKLSTTK